MNDYQTNGYYYALSSGTYTINGSGAIEDITVSDGTTYSGSATYLYVGKSNGKKYRTLVRFPNLSSSILGKNVVSASYEIRDIGCESASLQIECRRYYGSDWSESAGAAWSQSAYYGELLLVGKINKLTILVINLEADCAGSVYRIGTGR